MIDLLFLLFKIKRPLPDIEKICLTVEQSKQRRQFVDRKLKYLTAVFPEKVNGKCQPDRPGPPLHLQPECLFIEEK